MSDFWLVLDDRLFYANIDENPLTVVLPSHSMLSNLDTLFVNKVTETLRVSLPFYVETNVRSHNLTP